MARTDVQMQQSNNVTKDLRQVLRLIKEARPLLENAINNLEQFNDDVSYDAIVPYLGLELGGVAATTGQAGAFMTILSNALTALDSGSVKTLTDRLIE